MSSESTLTLRIVSEGADDAADSFGRVSQAAQQMGSDVNSAGGEMNNASQNIRDVGAAAKETAAQSVSFGAAVASIGTNIASAAAGVIGFVKSLENVDKAQDKVHATGTKLEQSNIRVAKAQTDLNAAIAAFGPNSAQAIAAQAKLDLELRKNVDAIARNENAIDALGFAMANAATGGIQFVASMANIAQVVNTIQGNIGALKTGFSGITSNISTLVSSFLGLGGAAGGASTAISRLGPMFGQFAGSTSSANAAIGSLGGALSNFGGAAGSATSILNKLGPAIATVAGVVGGVAIALVGADAATKAHSDTLKDLAQNYQKTGNVIKETGTGFDIIGNALNGLNKFLIENFSQWKQLNDVAAGGGQALKDAGADAAAAAEDLKKLQQVAQEVGDSLSKAWQKGLEGARSFKDKLGSEIEDLKTKALDLQKGFVIQADRPGTVKIDWEKVFEFERVQGLIKANMAKMQSAFSSGIEELAGRALPPGLASFGDRMMDALPSADEVSAMMSVLAAGVRKGGTGISEAAGFISAELREGFAGMDKPAQDAVVRIEQNLAKLATLKPNTPAFNETIRQIQADIAGLSDIDATIDIKASTVNVIAGVSQTTTALQEVPKETTTTFNANPQPAIQGANQAGTAITTQVPAEKSTTLSLEGVSQVMNDVGATAQAYGLVPGVKNTKITTDGAPLALAAIGEIGAGLAPPKYPDNKNTKVTLDGAPLIVAGATEAGKAITEGIPPLWETILKFFSGTFVQDAGAVRDTVKEIPGEKTTTLHAETATAQTNVQALSKEMRALEQVVGLSINRMLSAFSALKMPGVDTSQLRTEIRSAEQAVGLSVNNMLNAFRALKMPGVDTSQLRNEMRGAEQAVGLSVNNMIRAFGALKMPGVDTSQLRNEMRAAEQTVGLSVNNIIRALGAIQIPAVDIGPLRTAMRAAEQSVGTSVNNIITAIGIIQRAIDGLRSKTIYIDVVTRTKEIRAAGGFSGVISSPTRFAVGEGGHPEYLSRTPVHMAAGGFDGIVKHPTFFVAGEAGPELVNVIPLKGGTSSGRDIMRLADSIDRLIIIQKGGGGRGGGGGMNANLFLDGQRLATSLSKYQGTKSYGDR